MNRIILKTNGAMQLWCSPHLEEGFIEAFEPYIRDGTREVQEGSIYFFFYIPLDKIEPIRRGVMRAIMETDKIATELS